MPDEPTHTIYVDDSGNREYADNRVYTQGKTPLFVYAGLILTPAQAGAVTRTLRALKETTFGRPDVEIKSNWLRRRDERQRRYIEPYGVTEDQIRRFSDSCYRIVCTHGASLLAAVVNKAQTQEKYGDRAMYPPTICYEILVQRIQLEMRRNGGICAVKIDDTSGATPKGNKYRDLLRAHHASLLQRGSALIKKNGKNMQIDRLANLSFTDSAADERVQLADLVAYAVYRQFKEHGDQWDQSAGPPATYEYLEKCLEAFCVGPNDLVAGYGLVKFPKIGPQRWARGG